MLTPRDIAKHQIYNRACKLKNFLLGTKLPLHLGPAKPSRRRFSIMSHLLKSIPSLLCGRGVRGGSGVEGGGDQASDAEYPH